MSICPFALHLNSQRATFVLAAWQQLHHPKWMISLSLSHPFSPLHISLPKRFPFPYLLRLLTKSTPTSSVLPCFFTLFLLSCSPWRQSRCSQAEQPECYHVLLLQLWGCSSPLSPQCSLLPVMTFHPNALFSFQQLNPLFYIVIFYIFFIIVLSSVCLLSFNSPPGRSIGLSL